MITDLKKFIYEEEIKFKAAISESTWFKIGGAINFILHKNHQEKQFFANGLYSAYPMPFSFTDGITVFNFDAEIFNVYAFNLDAGSAGDTELDIKLRPQAGGTWDSIFTTTPKINYLTGGPTWVGIGDVISNTTAPVLTSGSNPLSVNKGDALRMDIIQAQTGASSCGMLVHYRPR